MVRVLVNVVLLLLLMGMTQVRVALLLHRARGGGKEGGGALQARCRTVKIGEGGYVRFVLVLLMLLLVVKYPSVVVCEGVVAVVASVSVMRRKRSRAGVSYIKGLSADANRQRTSTATACCGNCRGRDRHCAVGKGRDAVAQRPHHCCCCVAGSSVAGDRLLLLRVSCMLLLLLLLVMQLLLLLLQGKGLARAL